MLNYLFNAFKLNLYQQHHKKQRELKDDNVDVFDVEIIDEEYNEEPKAFADLAVRYILTEIEKVFDETTVGIWRMRYLLRVNDKSLNYKQIKQITRCTKYKETNNRCQ